LIFPRLNYLRYLAAIAAVCSAMFVPLYVLWLILNGSHMQYGDYFYMLDHLFSQEGTFIPSGLIVHANEHLVLIPKLIYLFNAKAFDGSNVSLGIIVWIISLAIAFLLAWQLRHIFYGSSVNKIILVWLFAAFLFPLAASHNYLHAMSGASWILANFFVVCALLFASNNRIITAGFFGLFATLSYGTGLAVWPALLLIVFLQRQVTWRTAVMALIGLAGVAFERWTSVTVVRHPLIEADPIAIMRSMQIASGSIFSNTPEIALLFGAISLIFIAFSFVFFIRAENVSASEKLTLGIIGYGIGVLFLFALSRSGFGDGVFLSSRYMGVIGLFTLGSILLSAFFFSQKKVWYFISSLLIILNLSASVPVLNKTKQIVLNQQELGAIAARLDIADGMIFVYGKQTGAILRSLNHYPFTAKGDKLFCDAQGQKVEYTLPAQEHGIHGRFDSAKPLSTSRVFQTDGWVHSENEIDCILMINNDNLVIGAAVRGWDRDDARQAIKARRKDIGWRGFALADSGAEIRTVVRLKDRPFLYEIKKGF
jgi:hypothetical protein